MLQQLWRAAAQRAAAAATTVPDARAAHEELPPDGAGALKFLRGSGAEQRRADAVQFSGITSCGK